MNAPPILSDHRGTTLKWNQESCRCDKCCLVILAFIQEATGSGKEKGEFLPLWALQSDPWSSVSVLSKFYYNVQ